MSWNLSRRRRTPKPSRRARYQPVLEVMENRLSPSVFTVINTNDAGPGSLRQAILTANTDPMIPHAINFAILPGGPQTIQLLSPLPPVTNAVVGINGLTQPGFAGVPLIELDGSNAGANADGLVLAAQFDSVTALVINRFGHHGIVLTGGGGHGVAMSYVGTNAAGNAGLYRQLDGVFMDTPKNLLRQNVISGNTQDGVEIKGPNANGNLALGNLIGTDAAGSAAVANLANGVNIHQGAAGNVIGMQIGNLISGNRANGVLISDGATGNLAQGNTIGLDLGGAFKIGNGADGVSINSASGNIIGGVPGLGPNPRNVISGNALFGVSIRGNGATENLVQGNLIGLDAKGTVKLGNGSHGVLLSSLLDPAGSVARNTIGGMVAGAGNVISGNTDDGVRILGSGATENQVQGNVIGLDPAATAKLGNGGQGVLLIDGAAQNTVGGTVAAARNIIAGNSGNGVHIQGTGTTGNRVQGNFIGTDLTGNGNLGNTKHGVFIGGAASDNTVGVTVEADRSEHGQGNTIAFNGGSGVVVESGTGNAIRRNSIFSNNSLGIDLGNDGVTLNHPGGPVDGGANRLQDFPVLTSAVADAAHTTVKGRFHGAQQGQFRLEFFANAVGDPSWYGQGQTFLGSLLLNFDAQGDQTFETVLPVGQLLTATATDATGDTSEFCSYVTVDSVAASLPSTRNAVAPNPRPAAGTFTTKNFALDFVPSAANDLLVVTQDAGRLTVTAQGLNVPNAPIRWQVDRNPDDTVAAGVPDLSAHMGVQITVTPNVPGNFRLICYLDADGNNTFETGEELVVLRMAIVRATIQPGTHTISTAVAFAGAASEVRTTTAMAIQADFLLEGGGADRLLGVDRVVLGDVGNLLNDTFVVSYPGVPNGTESEDPDFQTNPAAGFPAPMVDTSRVPAHGSEPTGADTPFRLRSMDTAIGAGPGGSGQIRRVTVHDAPGFGWDLNHPTTANPWATTAGGNVFREFLVVFSQTFPRNYVALASGDWTVTAVGNNVSDVWNDTGSAVTIQGAAAASAALTVAGFPQTGDAAGVQVLGLSFVQEVGMIVDPPPPAPPRPGGGGRQPGFPTSDAVLVGVLTADWGHPLPLVQEPETLAPNAPLARLPGLPLSLDLSSRLSLRAAEEVLCNASAFTEPARSLAALDQWFVRLGSLGHWQPNAVSDSISRLRKTQPATAELGPERSSSSPGAAVSKGPDSGGSNLGLARSIPGAGPAMVIGIEKGNKIGTELGNSRAEGEEPYLALRGDSFLSFIDSRKRFPSSRIRERAVTQELTLQAAAPRDIRKEREVVQPGIHDKNHGQV